MTTIAVVFAVLLGLGIGSFANVVIYRVPAGMSVVKPRSACPTCGTEIAARHNVPVVSWLWLRRRCATCGEPISARYPLVEFGTAVAYGLIVGVSGLRWETLLLLVFVTFSIILAAIDLDVRRLPNSIVAPMAVSVGVLILVTAAVDDRWGDALRALIGAAALGAFYFVAFVIYPKGLGFGDVKLAPVIGATLAFFGWGALIVGAFMAFVWGLVAAVVPMIRARRVVGVKIPFGPWMFLGAATGIAVGNAIGEWYLGSVLGF